MGLKLQQRTDTRQHLLQNSENSGTKEHRKGTSHLGTVMADIRSICDKQGEDSGADTGRCIFL